MNDERARAAAIQLSKCSQKGRDALASAGVPMNDVAPGQSPSSPGLRSAAVRVALKRAVEALVQYRRDLRCPPAVALVEGRRELVDDIISQASEALSADLLDRSERAQPEATPNEEM